jgi:hypothetical protein
MPQQLYRLPTHPGGVLVQQMKIVSVDGDFLVCHTWDGTTEGTDAIKVARPYLLRRTPFDGASRGSISYVYVDDQQRTSSKSGEDDITEYVTPNYLAADVIYAIVNHRGGTGVVDDGSLAVGWVDLNVDGRAWAQDDSE